ncbi:hypothetical protein X739_22340 [Mesorhizobium sp. LNHC220B00]|nr:hypothetical protein X739_22340 [Mesorhizobium sp. LNHC220B00]
MSRGTLMADLLVKLQTIATIVATGGGTYIAFAGLHAWKREMKGRRDIELCQHVIAQFYEADEKVRELRSPMSYPGVESADRPKRDHESEREAQLGSRPWQFSAKRTESTPSVRQCSQALFDAHST